MQVTVKQEWHVAYIGAGDANVFDKPLVSTNGKTWREAKDVQAPYTHALSQVETGMVEAGFTKVGEVSGETEFPDGSGMTVFVSMTFQKEG